MPGADLLDLETAIKKIPGVLGCVILAGRQGGLGEIQAFVHTGEDRARIEEAIRTEVSTRGLGDPRTLLLFELEAESHLGDRETLVRAAELAEQEARARGTAPAPPAPPRRAGPLRPLVARVVLSSSSGRSEAEVSLGAGPREVVGTAEGDQTSHGLRVLAEATLEACARLVQGLEFELKGASLVTTFDREAVLVVVQERGRRETIGAALVRDGPMSEAAVRATLDAVNRRLARA